MQIEPDILALWDGPLDDDREYGTDYDRRKALCETECGEIAEPLKDPNKREEALAKYLEKVDSAATARDGLREWHLLRVEGLDNATLIKALEIIAEKDDHYEIDSLMASNNVSDEVMIRGMQLLGELGKINNLAWNLRMPGLGPDVAEAIQSALIVAIDVQLEGDDLGFLDREKDIKRLLTSNEVNTAVKEKAKAALMRIRNPLAVDGVTSKPGFTKRVIAEKGKQKMKR